METLDKREAPVSGAECHRLESLLLDFDRNWNAAHLSATARELSADCPWRLAALMEMVKIDLEKQWQGVGRPRVEDYLLSYPELGTRDTVPADLLLAEFQARTQAGDAVSLEELAHRFPDHAVALHRLLEAEAAAGCQEAFAAIRTAKLRESTQAEGRPAPVALPLSGTFGRYRIVRLLGEGGMATVYLARDAQLGREVALKIPKPGMRNDSGWRARFVREAQAAATLNHPNICPVFDVGEVDGVPYLTMAFVEGRLLSHCLHEGPPLSPADAAAFVCKVARALAEAHARGVVHRDLKPSNIMIDRRGEPVIVDFGLARYADQEEVRLTSEGAILGTPAYMPPEQVNGDLKAIGAGYDVYSLGVVLYELLVGRLPFEGSLTAVLAQVLTQEPPPLSSFRADLDPQLEAVCLKALAKRPQDRHASMAEFVAALVEWQAGCAQPPSPARTGVGSSDRVVASTPRLVGGQPFWRGWPGIATAVVGALLLGVVLFVTTDHGTIEIELTAVPPDIKVEVDGKAIALKNNSATYRVQAGKHHLLVTGAGFETHSESFAIVRGEKKPVIVVLRPLSRPPAKEHPNANNARTGDAAYDGFPEPLRSRLVKEWASEFEALKRAIKDDAERLSRAKTVKERRHFERLIAEYQAKLAKHAVNDPPYFTKEAIEALKSPK